MAASMARVIWRSASSGESEAETVLICTWTGVVSGKASISRRFIAAKPRATRTSAAAITANRCRRDQVMMRSSMGLPVASAYSSQQPAPSLLLSSSDLSTWLPSAATTSPAATPAITSV